MEMHVELQNTLGRWGRGACRRLIEHRRGPASPLFIILRVQSQAWQRVIPKTTEPDPASVRFSIA